jgi:hypothetical protein
LKAGFLLCLAAAWCGGEDVSIDVERCKLVNILLKLGKLLINLVKLSLFQVKLQAKTTPIEALEDYACLIYTKITTNECRDYLKLSSNKQAYNILRSLNLPYTASRKSRHYYITPLLEKI